MKNIFLAIIGLGLSFCKNEVTMNQDIIQNSSDLAVVHQNAKSELKYNKNDLLGKFDPAKHPDFSKIPSHLTSKENVYLRAEALEAFEKMHQDAAKEGIKLIIISATRNFDSQKGIWEAKWNGSRLVEGQNIAITIKDPIERARKILRFSSMPGTSRHHWGTDIDINDLNDSYFLSGKGKKEYEWLVNNAGKYGFCQVYSPKGAQRPEGYEEEKWHWSYVPIASIMLKEYVSSVSFSDIQGFQGAETAEGLNVIKNYVAGINPQCN